MKSSCAVRPASTLMLAREERGTVEVYMLRRSSRSAFLPEMFVFPGGAVDPQDEEIAHTLLLREKEPTFEGREPSDPAFEVAALREAFEESGMLLAARADGSRANLDPSQLRGARAALHAGKTTFAEFLRELAIVLDARDLWHFSHWITPPTESRRFDTHFYLAAAPPDQIASTDEHETFAGLWISAQEALRRHAEGGFPMIFPTIMHLRRLAEYRTLAELCAFARTKEIHVVLPLASGNRDFSFEPGLESRW
jgi:8-oxo-dGTP pyrophosphatase MutT (NUDIX family)